MNFKRYVPHPKKPGKMRLATVMTIKFLNKMVNYVKIIIEFSKLYYFLHISFFKNQQSDFSCMLLSFVFHIRLQYKIWLVPA